MIGGFATWRNEPVTFDKIDTPNTTVQAANYMRVSPNTESSPIAPNIEVGLYAEKTGKATHSYGPRWSELTTQGGVTKAIKLGVNPTKPDRRNHTYMVVRQQHGNQWDILYDFNKVGSTGHQLKVPRGNPNRIDLGLEVMGPQFLHVPDIASRMQFMSEDKAWHQVASANTAKVISLGTCGGTRKPPYCFNAKLAGGSSFTQWTTGKPRKAAVFASSFTATSPRPSVAPQVPGRAEVYNGVDQRALHECLLNEPDGCLASVPGLSECVADGGMCNAEAAESASVEAPEETASISSEDIRETAAMSFAVSPEKVKVVSPSSSVSVAAGPDATQVWSVVSAEATPGLGHQEANFVGFRASYSAVTGRLIDACWGQMCEP